MDVNGKKNNSSSNRKDKPSGLKNDSNKQFEFTEEKFLNSKKNFDFDSVAKGKDKNIEDDFESIFSNSNNQINKNKPLIINHKNNKNIVKINNNLVNNMNNLGPVKGINNMPNFPNTSNAVIINSQKDDQNKIDLISFDVASEQKAYNINVNVIPSKNMNNNVNVAEKLVKTLAKEALNNRQSNSTQLKEADNFINNNNQSLFNYNFFSKSQNPNEQQNSNNKTNNNYNNSNNDSYVTALSKQPNQLQNISNNNCNNVKNMGLNVINVLNDIFDSNRSDLSNLHNPNLFSNNTDINPMFSNSTAYQMQNNINNVNNLIPHQQNFINRQSINNNILTSSQQGQSPIQIKNIPNIPLSQTNNINNSSNPNFFNYNQNQIPNNPNMFYPSYQQNIPNQINNQNMMPTNSNVQNMMNNMNMDNYDSDRIKKTLLEMDKVYNNTSNNVNNNTNIPNNMIQNPLFVNQNNYGNENNKIHNNIGNSQILMQNQNKIKDPQNQQQNKMKRSSSNALRNNSSAKNNYVNNDNYNNQCIKNNNDLAMNNKNNLYNNKPPENSKKKSQDEKQIENNDKNNQKIKNDKKEKNKSCEPDNENNQYNKSDINNINIINIETHINNISLNKEEDNNNIEKIANQFLFEQLSKGNLHWLISSKDIEKEKQIGFGGSSEVFKGNYRGTEVAIKKLRIIEVKDENLKEFKREVSSLIMLRHPNLVLFMGAM